MHIIVEYEDKETGAAARIIAGAIHTLTHMNVEVRQIDGHPPAPDINTENRITFDYSGRAYVGSSPGTVTTRSVNIENIIKEIIRGQSWDNILKKYPQLEEADIRAVLSYYISREITREQTDDNARM